MQMLLHRAVNGSMDTLCAGRPARWGAGSRGCHATRTGSWSRGMWTRAAHQRTYRHPGAAAGASRPEACKNEIPAGCSRRIRGFFLFYFQILKRFGVLGGFFNLFFFFRLLSPKAAEAAATRGGERRLGEPPLHLYPPAPGAAGRRAPGDLGAVVPAHSARGPEAGRPQESARCARAAPQRPLVRGGPLRGGPVPAPRAAGYARLQTARSSGNRTYKQFNPPARIMFINNVLLNCKRKMTK